MRVPAITLSENSTVYGELFRSHPIEVQVGTLHLRVVSNLDDGCGL